MFIIIEGIDRSGKSSIAEYYKKQGYQIVHMSAPEKKFQQPGYVGPSYCDECLEMYVKYSGQNVVFDRSPYGELVWPLIYGRKPQLDADEIDILKEIEDQNDAVRILMIDPNVEAHWKRCVDNKEPLNRAQFNAAQTLYSKMAHKYNFIIKTLPEFLKEVGEDGSVKTTSTTAIDSASPVPVNDSVSVCKDKEVETKDQSEDSEIKLTKEQERLAYANAINTILNKSILKSKGWPYDELEKDLRNHLNTKLGDLLGVPRNDLLSKEEVMIVKEFVKRLKEKQK